jgi:two-component system chemotaxis response regulator CheY
VNNLKILIAEDDFSSRKFLSKALIKYGKCDEALDGEEAYSMFVAASNKNDCYDLVCLDIMMPKLDGLELLSKIREFEKSKKNHKVKAIMLTALNDSKNIFTAFDEGAEAYIAKPINIKNLYDVIYRIFI